MKPVTRKRFIKQSCLASCLCGFAAIAGGNNASANPRTDDPKDPAIALIRTWLNELLQNMPESVSEEQVRGILKKSAKVHYENLNMDKLLDSFDQDREKFFTFLSEKWNWKIKYDEASNKIIADENKDFCVCPILGKDNLETDTICYCSEGFAELMFSKALGKEVEARVASSVRRGDKTCIYEITIMSDNPKG